MFVQCNDESKSSSPLFADSTLALDGVASSDKPVASFNTATTEGVSVTEDATNSNKPPQAQVDLIKESSRDSCSTYGKALSSPEERIDI